MEFPPAAQWAQDALAAYRDGPKRSSDSRRESINFVNDLGLDYAKVKFPPYPSASDESISDYRRDIRLPPDGVSKGYLLYQLANAYRRRWLEVARSEDLDDAVLGLWYSLLNTPQGSLETPSILEDFCYLLHRRFDGTGEGGNIVGHIEYVKSEIHKRNFGDELFLGRLLEVSTELENMIERCRLSNGMPKQARKGGFVEARERQKQQTEVQRDEAAPWKSRVEDFIRDAKDHPGPFTRAFRRFGDWLEDVEPEQPKTSSTRQPKASSARQPKASSTKKPKVSSTNCPKASSTRQPRARASSTTSSSSSSLGE
jgi:hypothetical protein